MSMVNDGTAMLLNGNDSFWNGERVKNREKEVTKMKITAGGRSPSELASARMKISEFLNDPIGTVDSSIRPE